MAKIFRQNNFKHLDLIVLVSFLMIVIGILVFFNHGSITTAVVTDVLNCGTLSSPGTYLLTQGVSAAGTCFTIESPHIVLDCQGNTITYSIDGGAGQSAVLNRKVGNNNLTIQNCIIIDGNSTSTEFRTAIDSRASSDSYFRNNDITTFYGKGILIESSPRNFIDNNIIQTRGPANSAIIVNTGHNVTIRFNTIKGTFGNGASGISIAGTTKDAFIEGNKVRSYDSAVQLSGNVNRTVLLNNNLFTQLSDRYEISDLLSEAYINYLIFNNSFGEVRWTDDGSGGFLRNLNVNSPDPNGFGLGQGITIGPNLVAVDTTILGGQSSLIDSNVLITVKNLPFPRYVNEVRKTNTMEIDSAAVLANGMDCLGTSCLYFCYNTNDPKFKFTSFGLSGGTPQASFAVNQNTQRGQIYVQEDVDDNGVIDDADIIPIVNHVLGANMLRDALFHTTDVTCDDSLNIYDIQSIVKAR